MVSTSGDGVFARIQSLPSIVANTKMCFPTGNPSTWSTPGSANRKRRTTSCESEVFLNISSPPTSWTIRSSESSSIGVPAEAMRNRSRSRFILRSTSVSLNLRLARTAYDVTLNDHSWSQEIFDVVSGNTSISWEKLDVN